VGIRQINEKGALGNCGRGMAWRGGVGGHSLIWPKWVRCCFGCKVFTVLILKQGIQFHYNILAS